MRKYDHQKIEKKWQTYWQENKLFQAKENQARQKFYGLIEFPYPSGDGLHTGHLRSNTAMDVICRKRRMQGYNVIYPIGFDAFGLPTENYAIKKNKKPQEVTPENIKIFTRQLKEAGFSFDWSRVFATTEADYYKWTQWIFIKLFEHGLAYKSKQDINWCTVCQIGLANEEVINGVCERCGGEVVKKEKEQWVLKITKYADRLVDDLDKVDYLDRIKIQQRNWIGRSYGASVKFIIKNKSSELLNEELEVFTTRPDTLFGATFMVIAPEHPLIRHQKSSISNYDKVEQYIQQVKKKSELERVDLNKEKTGIELKGVAAVNPVNNKELPIWVADYVMMGYGSGAIMAVPAHDSRDFEFAKKYKLSIVEVVHPLKEKQVNSGSQNVCYEGEGVAVNSGNFNGSKTAEFKKQIIAWLAENNLGRAGVSYKLRDWIFSRQRYWGEPIPLIYCQYCAQQIKKNSSSEEMYNKGELLNPGWVVDSNLPVKLPEIEDYKPTSQGESPLAKAKDWLNVKCPKCGSPAKRETDVMPNWAGSNWYFLRYTDPHNSQALAASDKLQYWCPVDWYNGGMEHTTLHLLYSRFIYKFLYDIGAVPQACGSEPYKKRTAHGMILGRGGIKMSKSKGNVVNPDNYISQYGADTVRLYEMFMGPFNQSIAWDDKGVIGIKRFLDKAWKLQDKLRDNQKDTKEVEVLTHQSIKKVSQDIEKMRFNTAISQLMIFANKIEEQASVSKNIFEKFILLLSPFAPHICEELWSALGHKTSISLAAWPVYDKKMTVADEIELVIQVNGKVRDKLSVDRGLSKQAVEQLAKQSDKVKKWLTNKEPKKIIYVPDKLINIVV